MLCGNVDVESNCHIVVETIDAEELVHRLPSLEKQDRISVIEDKFSNGRVHANRLFLDLINKHGLQEEFLESLHHTGYSHLLEFLTISCNPQGTALPPPPYQSKVNGSCHVEEQSQLQQSRNNSFVPGKVVLFGRKEIIHKIVSDIAQTETKCVVIEGSPGCGKTSVAVAACHELIQKGTTCNFVDLRSVQSPNGVMHAILTSLCHGNSMGQESPSGKVFEVLQHFGKKRVLLLDNAEDCLRTDELKDDFLEITKRISMVKDVKIIITSRVSIRICQLPMKKYHMKGLPKEAALSMLTTKVSIGQSLANDLAQQCGYTPLALEVVAALIQERIKAEDILMSLKQGKAMKVLSPDFLGNKEKLISCISASYDCLDVRLRCGFISLAVFPRSFCANAAASVLGITQEEAKSSILGPLTRRCLLEFDEEEERWTFHVLLRSFALEVRKQDADVKHVVSCQTYTHRFCSYFVKFLQHASQNFLRRTLDCIQQCETECFNIQDTLKLAKDPIFATEFSRLTDGEIGAQFRDLLACVISVEDQISFYQYCVVEAQRRGNLEREAALLCKLASVYISSVNCTFMTLPDGPGVECLQRILHILHKLDVVNSVPLARCLAEVGSLETEILHFDKASEHLKKALDIQETNGDCKLATALTLTELGKAEMCNSHLEEANYFLLKSHVLLQNYCKQLESLGKPSIQASCGFADTKKYLGHLYLTQNQFDDALKMFQEANDLRQLYAPNHPNTRFTTDGIAHCYLKMKEYKKALQFYEKSLELRRKVVGVELPVNTKVLSYVYFEMGKMEKSFELEEKVMSMWERSMRSNMACMKFLRDEQSKKFVYTVFYALVHPDQRKEIEEFIFVNPPTTREIRIREFAHAMWSSERVAVMHLEPERYQATASHLKKYYNGNVIGEICALENHCEDDWNGALEKMNSFPAAQKSCLVIIRPMPPLGKQALRLLPVTCRSYTANDHGLSQTVTPSKKNISRFCSIL